MILIADSGASKTDWILIKDNQSVENIETLGINPVFKNSEEITSMLMPAFDNNTKASVKEIYFYGAGCIKDSTDKIVMIALTSLFPNAKIEVYDDMFGAARALLGNTEGIACILGTGSNSCRYDGEKISDKVPALGYVLGDEGGGAYLGKIFINDYFKRAIPDDLSQIIQTELKLEMPQVVTAVYKQDYPSRYLAGFSKFFIAHLDHPYIKSLIKCGFEAFLSKNVQRYKDYESIPISFVGSIAYYYLDILKEVADSKNMTIGTVLHKPIEGLMKYHKGK